MTKHENVPMIIQEKTMSCWHASARMIWGYKYKQSINPLSNVYEKNTGISAAQFVDLAKSLGLESVPKINMSYTVEGVDNLLKKYGPLWAAGHWYGAPHIIVITGVNADGVLYVNDPGFGPRQHDMKFFNERIASEVENPIMYLPASRANSKWLQDLLKK